PFILAQRRTLARSAARHEKMHALVNLAPRQPPHARLIQRAALDERRHERGSDSRKWRSHNRHLFLICRGAPPPRPTTALLGTFRLARRRLIARSRCLVWQRIPNPRFHSRIPRTSLIPNQPFFPTTHFAA